MAKHSAEGRTSEAARYRPGALAHVTRRQAGSLRGSLGFVLAALREGGLVAAGPAAGRSLVEAGSTAGCQGDRAGHRPVVDPLLRTRQTAFRPFVAPAPPRAPSTGFADVATLVGPSAASCLLPRALLCPRNRPAAAVPSLLRWPIILCFGSLSRVSFSLRPWAGTSKIGGNVRAESDLATLSPGGNECWSELAGVVAAGKIIPDHLH